MAKWTQLKKAKSNHSMKVYPPFFYTFQMVGAGLFKNSCYPGTPWTTYERPNWCHSCTVFDILFSATRSKKTLKMVQLWRH